jgi:hypothetical protein
MVPPIASARQNRSAIPAIDFIRLNSRSFWCVSIVTDVDDRIVTIVRKTRAGRGDTCQTWFFL